jgi:RNA-directed DNA polymerase
MRERNTPAHQEIERESVAWNKLPWKKLEQHVYSIQKRIYQASQRGEKRKVEKLQKLLMKSRSARLLAVRRVTQDNQNAFTQSTGRTANPNLSAASGYPSLGRKTNGGH